MEEEKIVEGGGEKRSKTTCEPEATGIPEGLVGT